jgi:hypothetical protein
MTETTLYDNTFIMRKVGRPEMKASEKRAEFFRFMVTSKESATIRRKAKAAGLTLSQYLRQSALKG